MKILIINGNPRPKGLISQMLGVMQSEAVTKGAEVEVVRTNDVSIKTCVGYQKYFKQ